ncbi:hypothetical protein OPKNFCMD_1178 [Methylobacterium crusticola]|uniref:HOOK family protein n=1 Tax=Methylobacterium crusticola TaxID=1697972 RepID=A0ABQ4QU33_9HYPH|nr:hypothetical protein [Methylobacterium crusticola]GJD48459.1 hypothetical protein OPKNFCMD_1178 [Methylobacterium crusticola]
MQSSTDFIDSLAHEHARLGRLLQVIDSGRWWTTSEPGRVKVEALTEQATRIKDAIDAIEEAVGQLGS